MFVCYGGVWGAETRLRRAKSSEGMTNAGDQDRIVLIMTSDCRRFVRPIPFASKDGGAVQSQSHRRDVGCAAPHSSPGGRLFVLSPPASAGSFFSEFLRVCRIGEGRAGGKGR